MHGFVGVEQAAAAEETVGLIGSGRMADSDFTAAAALPLCQAQSLNAAGAQKERQ